MGSSEFQPVRMLSFVGGIAAIFLLSWVPLHRFPLVLVAAGVAGLPAGMLTYGATDKSTEYCLRLGVGIGIGVGAATYVWNAGLLPS